MNHFSFKLLESFKPLKLLNNNNIHEDINKDFRFNVENIKFFNLNYDEKFAVIEDFIIHIKKNTYFRNVYIFINRIKNIKIIKDDDVV